MQTDWIYPEPTFRMAARAETVTTQTGHPVLMRLCESFEAGRWEPFYTYEAVYPEAKVG